MLRLACGSPCRRPRPRLPLCGGQPHQGHSHRSARVVAHKSGARTLGLNNPVKYTDPSGHIAQGEEEDALKIIDYLRVVFGVYVEKDFGLIEAARYTGNTTKVWIEGAWLLDDLRAVMQGVTDMAQKYWGSDGDSGARGFRQTIGRVHIYGRKGMTVQGLQYTVVSQIDLNTGDPKNPLGANTVVHELAHEWDWNHFGALSRGLTKFVAGRGSLSIRNEADLPNAYEDWADTVEADVYPEAARNAAWSRAGTWRENPALEFKYTRRSLYVSLVVSGGQ